MLNIYNSLTSRKQEFIPLEEGKIGVYVCGMTVYDYCHLGHARVMVAFDAIIRYLRYRGYHVTYVRNITDIDDKIINRANELGESVRSLTDRFIECMHEDFSSLGTVEPDTEPRATEFIPQIIEMISRLIDSGHAYHASNNDVYYRVRKFTNYGQLSGKNLDELQSGARVERDESKEDPLDFVLWKHAKPDEPFWDSPWGKGRPGWHIECSAMSTSLLGNNFDIHGGGIDLLFPHHENEIAQSEAVTGEPFVNCWMHNGHLNINAEKMSKSLKNFLTIREIFERDADHKKIGEILRMIFLSSHYRSPLSYSEDGFETAKSAIQRIYFSLDQSERYCSPTDFEIEPEYAAKFNKAMDDDFNTPEALSVIFECVRELNRCIEKKLIQRGNTLRATLLELTSSLGIAQLSAEQFFRSAIVESDDMIESLISKRVDARKTKQWDVADQIRDELTELGIAIEDRSDGTSSWRRA